MKQFNLSLAALTLAAASVGCAWTGNVALYRIWTLVPPEVFPIYQAEHARLFVPLAVLFGLPNIILTLLVAWRGLPGMPRWPLQEQLRIAGPTPALVGHLVNSDVALRAVPPTLQVGVLLWAIIVSARQEQRTAGSADARLRLEQEAYG